MKSKNLRLVVMRRDAGYVDGSVQIGLFEAEDGETDAHVIERAKLAAGIQPGDRRALNADADFSIVSVDQFVEVARIPSTYRDY